MLGCVHAHVKQFVTTSRHCALGVVWETSHSRRDEQRGLCTRLVPHVPVAQGNAKLRWEAHGVRHAQRGTVRKTLAFVSCPLLGHPLPPSHITAVVPR